MANKIINNINFDMKARKRSFEQTRKYYVGKEQIIMMDGVKIHIKLDEESYDKIFEQKILNPNSTDFISPDESIQWI